MQARGHLDRVVDPLAIQRPDSRSRRGDHDQHALAGLLRGYGLVALRAEPGSERLVPGIGVDPRRRREGLRRTGLVALGGRQHALDIPHARQAVGSHDSVTTQEVGQPVELGQHVVEARFEHGGLGALERFLGLVTVGVGDSGEHDPCDARQHRTLLGAG